VKEVTTVLYSYTYLELVLATGSVTVAVATLGIAVNRTAPTLDMHTYDFPDRACLLIWQAGSRQGIVCISNVAVCRQLCATVSSLL
jgi:hypothetical protein